MRFHPEAMHNIWPHHLNQVQIHIKKPRIILRLKQTLPRRIFIQELPSELGQELNCNYDTIHAKLMTECRASESAGDNAR